jgi:hypothetical protein
MNDSPLLSHPFHDIHASILRLAEPAGGSGRIGCGPMAESLPSGGSDDG